MGNTTGIKSLTIQRFRGIAEGSLEDLVDVNVLVGRNNSGKSTVLEAIHLLSTWMVPNRPPDPLGRTCADVWASTRSEASYPNENLWYRGNSDQPICLGAFVRDVRVEAVYSRGGHVATTPKPPAAPVLEFLSRVSVFRPKDLEHRGAEEKNWSTVLRTRGDRQLVVRLNEIFDLGAEQYQLLPGGALMVLFPKEGVLLDLQGDGVRLAFRCLLTVASLQQTVLMLEEPECFLHPGALRRYAKALCGWARDQAVQLILTTHSLECVRYFLDAAEAAKAQGAVFHLSRSDGRLSVKRIEAADFRALEAAETDVRFLDQYS